MKRIDLNNWQVKGFYPHVPHLGNSLETGAELLGITDWIPAQVPGCVQGDLERAGWIDNPYLALNSLKCEWVENRWWMYRTSFACSPNARERVQLVLEGVDNRAHLYLNQSYVGCYENMFVPIIIQLDEYLSGQDHYELVVLLEHAPEEMGQIGYTSRTATQKSRFAYKWDFSTRMVPLGIWGACFLRITNRVRLEDVHMIPTVDQGLGTLAIRARIDEGEVSRATGSALICKALLRLRNQLELSVDLACQRHSDGTLLANGEISVSQPELWQPNGSGNPTLYSIRVELIEDGAVSDCWEGQVGFRTVRWLPNDDTPADALPYKLHVNDRDVYIKGVNLTPLDIQYAAVTRSDYAEMTRWLKRANINLVRIWGGGLIEKEAFYDDCDQAGIMVWQEFIQSSSGIDNVPSKLPEFLRLLEQTAVHAIKTKRNHTSLVCWSGGNELTDEKGVPVTSADANIAMLQELVDTLDPGRYFLPSSASGPNEFLNPEQPGCNHDVHGPWKYGGIVGHYQLFNESDSLLHSEFGVDGCASYSSMKRFLPADAWFPTAMKDHAVWRHHGEWWCTLERDRELFGEFSHLDWFAKASQWTQAEGIRYALEANRRRSFRNSGSIVWQFNEPFPNASCTSLLDYFRVPKMAYYALQRAYSPLLLSLKYDSLTLPEGSEFRAACYLQGSDRHGLEAGAIPWSIEAFDLSGCSLWQKSGATILPAKGAIQVADIAFVPPVSPDGVFFVRLRVAEEEPNVYAFSTLHTRPFEALMNLKPTELEWRCMAERAASSPGGPLTSRFEVINKGPVVACYVEAIMDNESLPLYSKQQYAILLPGESRRFEVEDSGAGSASTRFTCWNHIQRTVV